jgi:hypothetical protein
MTDTPPNQSELDAESPTDGKRDTVPIAVLDQTGLLVGYEDKAVAELTVDDIPVPDKDLEPHRYRWDFEIKTFRFLGRMTVVPEQGVAPDKVLRAIADGLRFLFKSVSSPGAIPESTRRWLEFLDKQEADQVRRGMNPRDAKE